MSGHGGNYLSTLRLLWLLGKRRFGLTSPWRAENWFSVAADTVDTLVEQVYYLRSMRRQTADCFHS